MHGTRGAPRSDPGSKLARAQELGVTVIDERRVLAMQGKQGAA